MKRKKKSANKVYIEVFLSKSTMIENLSPFSSTKGSIASTYTEILYYLTITITNKCFKFQNDWFKIICIRYNCTLFCPIPLCWRSRKFRPAAEPQEKFALN